MPNYYITSFGAIKETNTLEPIVFLGEKFNNRDTEFLHLKTRSGVNIFKLILLLTYVIIKINIRNETDEYNKECLKKL